MLRLRIFWATQAAWEKEKGLTGFHPVWSNKSNNMILNSTHCIILFFFSPWKSSFSEGKNLYPPPRKWTGQVGGGGGSFNILTLESTWMISIEMLVKAKLLLVLYTRETILKCCRRRRRRRRLWRRRGRRSLGDMGSLGDSEGSLRPPSTICQNTVQDEAGEEHMTPSSLWRGKRRRPLNWWLKNRCDHGHLSFMKKIKINIESSG